MMQVKYMNRPFQVLMENSAFKDEMQFEKIFDQGAGLKRCLTKHHTFQYSAASLCNLNPITKSKGRNCN